MGVIRNRSQLLGAVGVVVAIVVGAALPVVLGASGSAALARGRAPVSACSPPQIAGPGQPVASASPPCTPMMSARPHTGLRDGQTITVTGSGFAPDSFILIEECLAGATTDAQCEFEEASFTDTSATGTFSTSVPVLRLLSTETSVTDCARRGACVVAALGPDDITIEAATPIVFKKIPLPTLSVAPSTALSDGQNVVVTGSNFAAGQQMTLAECPAAAVPFYQCDSDATAPATADASGAFTVDFDVARILSTDQVLPSSVDCAVTPGCVLAAFSPLTEELVIPAPLSFNPAVPPLPPLNVTLNISPPALIGVGGAVTLSGTISCSSATPVDVNTMVNLSETADALEAVSSLTTQETCVTTPAPVTITLPEENVPFVAGIAEITLDISARNGSATTDETVSAALTLAVAAHTPPPVYYVALGDSLAEGPISPNPFIAPVDQGYTTDLLTDLRASNPNIEVVDLACPDETTTTMIQGGSCSYSSGSTEPQLAAATTFLAAHRASVALVTIDVGGYDDVDCISDTPPFYVDSCIQNADATVSSNLTTIVAQLRTAAGASVPIAGMNYFDPFLDEWPTPILGHSIAKESVPVVVTLNSIIGSVYAGAQDPVADVQTAFATTDLSHKVKTSIGRVPVAVANTCSWLDFTCSKDQGGFGENTDAAGAAVIAGAFEKVLPPGLTAGVRARTATR
jgi:hypothetical protein